MLQYIVTFTNAGKNTYLHDKKKDAGSARIHQLRVIHLYDCDLNLLLRLFLQKLDQHCEDDGLINKGTYGSRANRRAVDPVIVDVT